MSRRPWRSTSPGIARWQNAPTSGWCGCNVRMARGTSTTAPILWATTRWNRTSSMPTCAPMSPSACGITTCSRRTTGSSSTCGRWSSAPSTSCSTCSGPAERFSGRATPTARRGRSRCSPVRRRSVTRCAARSRWPNISATSAPTGSCRPAGSPTSSPTSPKRSRRNTGGPWTGTTRCSPA